MTTNRLSMIVAISAISVLAILTISMATSLRKPDVASSASRAYDQIERDRVARYEAAAVQQAYADQRSGEQTTAQYIDPQQVLQDFRHSEQMAGQTYDVQQAYLGYREGEWNAGVSPAQAYLNYRRGEWTGK